MRTFVDASTLKHTLELAGPGKCPHFASEMTFLRVGEAQPSHRSLPEVVLQSKPHVALGFVLLPQDWFSFKDLKSLNSRSGRVGRSYSDRCLEILTGLLALKQEHITSGKTSTHT